MEILEYERKHKEAEKVIMAAEAPKKLDFVKDNKTNNYNNKFTNFSLLLLVDDSAGGVVLSSSSLKLCPPQNSILQL